MRYMTSTARMAGLVLAAALLAACGQQGAGGAAADAAADVATPGRVLPADPAAIGDAIASPQRLAGDAEEDERRHPQEVLEFLGVAPGMQVLDFLGGGGYYTELLARTVGPEGSVVAYNNALFNRFYGEKLGERLADDRLANVQPVLVEVNDLVLEPGSLDAALLVMSYHDLYHSPAEGEAATDIAQLLGRLHAAMKTGGTVVVQDHVADAGVAEVDAADRLHRIDPAVVRRDFTAAGFEFDADSALFANADDDHSQNVFDDSIRGRTDRFMLRFHKPAGTP